METEVQDFFQVNTLIKSEIAHRSGKPIFIYGVSLLEQRLFRWLWRQDLVVDGLVLSEDEQGYVGLEFMLKPIVSLEDYRAMPGEKMLVCCSMTDKEALSMEGIEAIVAIEMPVGNLIAYGAGARGGQFAKWARKHELPLLAICDKDKGKWGEYLEGVPIAGIDSLRNIQESFNLVVTLDKKIAGQVAIELVERMQLDSCYAYNYGIMEELSKDGGIDAPNSSQESDWEWIYSLVYYLGYISKKGKRIIFWGKLADVLLAMKRMSSLGVSIGYGISEEDKEGVISEFEIHNRYDLMYENPNELLVMALSGSVETVRKFIVETGLPEEIFCWNNEGSQPFTIYRDGCFDPSLGHNVIGRHSASVLRAATAESNNGKKLRIGILGGSTSDLIRNPERSWPLQMVDVAQEHGVEIEVYDGAVSGYSVAQELIKFVRDMSHLQLDMLISFSRVNEVSQTEKRNHFISHTQASLFEHLAREAAVQKNTSWRPVVCYGDGIADYAENWLHCEKLLAGMCNEFGIRFRAVIQPWLFGKSPSKYDKEIKLHVMHLMGDSSLEHTVEQIRLVALAAGDNCPWLVDGAHIFDGSEEQIYLDTCHVTTRGNRMIAEWMFSLVVEAMGIKLRR